MLTTDYIHWFMRTFTDDRGAKVHSDSTIYLYLLLQAVELGQDVVPLTSQLRIANELGVNQSTVSRSLIRLANKRVLKMLPGGLCQFLPPDANWINAKKLHSKSICGATSFFVNNSRAQEEAASGKPTLQGRDSPPKPAAMHCESTPNHDADETVNRAAVASKGEAFLQRMREQMQRDNIKRAIGDTLA